MKNRIVAIVGLALLAAVSASAQNIQTNQFKVPFAFMVGETTLPAADYRVQYTPDTGEVRLQARTGGGIYTLTDRYDYRPERANPDALQFQRFGNIWVLKQVRVSGYEQKLLISKSRQAELAKLNTPGQQTLVASVVPIP